MAGTDRLLALVTGHELDDLLAHPPEVSAQADQDRGGDAFALAHQTEQHVLRPDVAVAQLQSLAERELQDLLGPRGERRGAAGCRAGHPDGLLDLLAHGLEGDPE